MVVAKKVTQRRQRQPPREQTTKRAVCYLTHFQGDRPYRVCVRGQTCELSNETKTWRMSVPQFSHIWPGDNGQKSDGFTPRGKFRGNAVLVRKGKEYFFVGETVRKFTLPDNDSIVAFYSPMGLGFAPLPYAIGQRNTYMFTHRQKSTHAFAYVSNADDAARKPEDPPIYLHKDKRVKYLPFTLLHDYETEPRS